MTNPPCWLGTFLKEEIKNSYLLLKILSDVYYFLLEVTL